MSFNIIIPIILIFILPIIIFIAIQYFTISEINLLFLTLEISENLL